MAIQATQESGDSAFNRGKTVRAHEYLEELGVEHFYDLKYGSHDWGVWRDAFTTFVKDILWDVEKTEPSQYPTGVSVTENTNENYSADYMAHFVYEDANPNKTAIKVKVYGGFQFYKPEEVKDFVLVLKITVIFQLTVYMIMLMECFLLDMESTTMIVTIH